MMTIEQIRQRAGEVAAELRQIGEGPVPKDLRRSFIEVRAALFQRGLFDPVLVRFDSATAPPASPAEVAAQLAAMATSLQI